MILHCPYCDEVGNIKWLYHHLRHEHQLPQDEAYTLAGDAEPISEHEERPF